MPNRYTIGTLRPGFGSFRGVSSPRHREMPATGLRSPSLHPLACRRLGPEQLVNGLALESFTEGVGVRSRAGPTPHHSRPHHSLCFAKMCGRPKGQFRPPPPPIGPSSSGIGTMMTARGQPIVCQTTCCHAQAIGRAPRGIPSKKYQDDTNDGEVISGRLPGGASGPETVGKP